jgi:hypothetical protein
MLIGSYDESGKWTGWQLLVQSTLWSINVGPNLFGSSQSSSGTDEEQDMWIPPMALSSELRYVIWIWYGIENGIGVDGFSDAWISATVYGFVLRSFPE